MDSDDQNIVSEPFAVNLLDDPSEVNEAGISIVDEQENAEYEAVYQSLVDFGISDADIQSIGIERASVRAARQADQLAARNQARDAAKASRQQYAEAKAAYENQLADLLRQLSDLHRQLHDLDVKAMQTTADLSGAHANAIHNLTELLDHASAETNEAKARVNSRLNNQSTPSTADAAPAAEAAPVVTPPSDLSSKISSLLNLIKKA